MRIRSAVAAYLLFGLASCQTTRPEARIHLSCGGETLRKSWAELEDRIPDGTMAKALANAYLCLPESESQLHYLHAHLDETVEFSTYSTGELEEEREILSREAAKGEIRGFQGSKEFEYSARLTDEGDVMLDGRNEACIEGITLTHRGETGWLIRELGSACD